MFLFPARGVYVQEGAHQCKNIISNSRPLHKDVVAGFADFDPQEPENYQLQNRFAERPASVGTGGSLFISGMNRSDDLFMYHKRRLIGLEPNAPYRATFRVVLASKYVSTFGSGGNPAKSVFLKGCSSPYEPTLVLSDGAYRLDIDIGRQAFAGKNSIVLGDIEKPNDNTNDYALLTRASDKPLPCTAAADGSIWILIGTDSGYEGETALYYTEFEIALDR